MDSDERFKHLAKDPRFKVLHKRKRKVEIDARFQSMFEDKKFAVDSTNLKKYYSLEEEDDKKENDEQDDNEDEEEEDNENEEEEDNEDEEEAECTDETSDVSSSSDEADSDDDEGEEPVVKEIQYDWQPLDHDAETTDIATRRLAIQNLDWDHLDVKDLFILVNSIRPPLSVKIYVSEFGKERIKQEELEGPKEIIEMPAVDEEEAEYNMLEDKMKALKDPHHKINEYEDADDALDPKNEEMRERIRRYQLSRMKYYYAVAEFDSVESAELVYKELDGREYEGSSLELDLRFIPDDIEFDKDDVKSECNKLPDMANYKAPQFINSALQQTTVKFTWDETDVKRQEKLRRAYTKEELERDDLEAYLASDTETEEEIDDDETNEDQNDAVSVVTANSEARVNKYKLLLQSLEEEAEKKKKIDVDVKWSSGSENSDSDGSNGSDGSDGSDESDSESSGAESPGAEIHTSKKRPTAKRPTVKKPTKKPASPDRENELDLLVMDVNAKRDEFKFNPEDDRFKAVYESGVYNIDPSHPNFKRTQAFDVMAEKKREKRQKTRDPTRL